MVLRIQDWPDDIQVDARVAFGAAARLQEVEASSDAAWLVRADSEQARPAVFLYGGVTIEPWSDDRLYAAFPCTRSNAPNRCRAR